MMRARTGRYSCISFLRKNYVILFIAFTSIIAFVVMRSAASGLRFWFDELISINFAKNDSIWSAIKDGVSADGNGVLFNVLLFFFTNWFHTEKGGRYYFRRY
jgi:hypothetical protein